MHKKSFKKISSVVSMLLRFVVSKTKFFILFCIWLKKRRAYGTGILFVILPNSESFIARCIISVNHPTM